MAKDHTKPDYILLGTIIAILFLGILILASVSASFSYKKFGDTYHFLKHQIFFGLIPGIILAYFAYRIKLSFLKKWIPTLLLVNLVLMILVFFPFIGSSDNTAARWVYIGPFSFQPSEFLKLTFILYLASWLISKTEKIKPSKNSKGFGQTFIAFLVVLGVISLLLFFQSDVSTLGIVILVALLMYFSINTPLWHSVLAVLIGVTGLFTLIKLAPYRINRLLVFLNPDLDPMGIGYQIKQALIAIGSGGIIGVGLGMSNQKLGFLPQTISDSIFAVFSEEAGFIGGIILIFLFLLFFWRGIKISKNTKDKFSQLTALGISSWIIIQSFVNIGAMIGILPLTGIPLPFISYGGSALVTELIAVGLLLNISKN